MNKNVELRQSHIIPEFMYQNLSNKEPRRYYKLSVEDNKKHKEIKQKGIRERLLCGECEKRLNEFEIGRASCRERV